MHSLVISIFLYTFESCTLMAELEKRTQAFEIRCYQSLLNISYKDHNYDVTNKDVSRKIKQPLENITLVKKWKLMVWPYLKVFWLSKDDSAGHSARKKKKW